MASTPQIVTKLNLEKLPPLKSHNEENYSSSRQGLAFSSSLNNAL
jgi:hypothetical protein|tara:strand:- start:378 stop:512 length:135 start_codon:yes stop_codon:yes gene_type:complete